jgi:hypothetical protein
MLETCGTTVTGEAKENETSWRTLGIRVLPGLMMLAAILIMFGALVAVVIVPLFLDTRGYSHDGDASPLAAVSQDGAKYFEALARFITVVITIVAVIGTFFGYLLRKSIREIEQDFDRRFDREKRQFDDECTNLRSRFDRDLEGIESALEKKVPELEERIRALENAVSTRERTLEAKERLSQRSEETAVDEVIAAMNQIATDSNAVS